VAVYRSFIVEIELVLSVVRHVACNLTFTASREDESKAIVKKQLSVSFSLESFTYFN
jgi:hypothetical protein